MAGQSSSAGFGMCDGCGTPLTDGEMLLGDLCVDCERDPVLDDDPDLPPQPEQPAYAPGDFA